MIPIRTERLIIRNWQETDRDLFYRINCDDTVMAYFPFRRSREEADRFMDELRADIDRRGYGFTALERIEDGVCIGFTGISPTRDLPSRQPQAVEIGWRLAPEYWGQGYVTEAATAILDLAFNDIGLKEIVSFAVTGNHRSTAVMERLGMHRRSEADFNHPNVPASCPRLARHVVYVMAKNDWAHRKKPAR